MDVEEGQGGVMGKAWPAGIGWEEESMDGSWMGREGRSNCGGRGGAGLGEAVRKPPAVVGGGMAVRGPQYRKHQLVTRTGTAGLALGSLALASRTGTAVLVQDYWHGEAC